jgi:hypothetical protein
MCVPSCGGAADGACCVDNTCAAPLRCLCDRGAVCHTVADVGGDCDCDEFCKPTLHCDFATQKCASGAPADKGSSCCP